MLNTQDKILIEQRVANEKPSAAVAYILLLFLGLLGAHRFYLGRVGSAIAMLLISLTIVGAAVTLVWCIVDLFLRPGIVREAMEDLRRKYTMDAMTNNYPA
jgi:TM2 domain-containing membrane protein YozV